jgi:hypothetical protein
MNSEMVGRAQNELHRRGDVREPAPIEPAQRTPLHDFAQATTNGRLQLSNGGS